MVGRDKPALHPFLREDGARGTTRVSFSIFVHWSIWAKNRVLDVFCRVEEYRGLPPAPHLWFHLLNFSLTHNYPEQSRMWQKVSLLPEAMTISDLRTQQWKDFLSTKKTSGRLGAAATLGVQSIQKRMGQELEWERGKEGTGIAKAKQTQRPYIWDQWFTRALIYFPPILLPHTMKNNIIHRAAAICRLDGKGREMLSS